MLRFVSNIIGLVQTAAEDVGYAVASYKITRLKSSTKLHQNVSDGSVYIVSNKLTK